MKCKKCNADMIYLGYGEHKCQKCSHSAVEIGIQEEPPNVRDRLPSTINQLKFKDDGISDLLDEVTKEIYKQLMSKRIGKLRGKWLPTNDNDKKRCSVCDTICMIAVYPSGDANYCPNCGVEMTKEESDHAGILLSEI